MLCSGTQVLFLCAYHTSRTHYHRWGCRMTPAVNGGHGPTLLSPYRLWSLWDVIRGSLTGLAPLIYQLSLYQLLDDPRDGESDLPLGEPTIEQVLGWLKIAEAVANDFQIQAAEHRIDIFKKCLKKNITWRELSVQSRVLREAIESGLKGQLIYRYDNVQSAFLDTWTIKWKQVIGSFPSTFPDIRAAVDCWALGHGTASVFHCMRILEYGLAALEFDSKLISVERGGV